jgi:hypothetical protein
MLDPDSWQMGMAVGARALAVTCQIEQQLQVQEGSKIRCQISGFHRNVIEQSSLTEYGAV